jgi:hypothetical protein
MDKMTLWSLYAQGIAQAAGLPGAPGNLILNGSSQIAPFAVGSVGLGSSAPTEGEANLGLYQIADTELLPQFVYDSANASFFSDWANYIDNLTPQGATPPSPSVQAQLQLIQAALKKAQTQYTADFTAAVAAYTQASTLLPGQYKNFSDYLSQTAWGTTLNQDNDAVVGQNSKLTTIYTSVFGKDYVAINLAKKTVDSIRTDMLGSAVNDAEMAGSSNGTSLVLPAYAFGESYTQFAMWVDSCITAHQVTDPSAQKISFTVTSDSADADFSHNTYYSHTESSSGFWFFRSGSDVTTSSSSTIVDTSNSAFQLTFGFDAIQGFDVSRGPWYDSSLRYAYQSNNVVPTRLIIGMYPQIKITMDAASYANAKSAYNSSSGFGAGGFWTSGASQTSTSQQTMQSAWDDNSNSVVIAPEDPNPIILAMLVSGN